MIKIRKFRTITTKSLLIQRKFAFFPVLIRSNLDSNGYCTETKVWLQYYYSWQYSYPSGTCDDYVWSEKEFRYLTLSDLVKWFTSGNDTYWSEMFTPMNIFTTDAIMNELEKLHPALLPNVEDF